MTYTAAGHVLSTTYPSGVVTTSTYSAQRGWLLSREHAKGGASLLSLSYTRAATGRIDAITVPGNAGSTDAWTYGCEELDELTQATNAGNGSLSESCAYDLAGNITSKTGTGVNQIGTYSYPAQGGTSVRPHGPTQAGSFAIADGTPINAGY